MYTIGIDIGTTKIAGVLLDTPEYKISQVISTNSNADIESRIEWERIQDPHLIVEKAESIIKSLKGSTNEPIHAIGVSSQMHGFLYVNTEGEALSPLYTWQDSRAMQPIEDDGKTALDLIKDKTGLSIYSGYGLATHYYNEMKGLVPETSYKMVSIGGYLAMKLCGISSPSIDPSESAGFGLYNQKEKHFYPDLNTLWDTDDFLPETVPFYTLFGVDSDSIPVYQPIGDNQASFIGAMAGRDNQCLINLGTSGQISIISDRIPETLNGLEVRPFPENNLIVGSTLAGGKSIELIVELFRDILAFFDKKMTREEMYKIINSKEFMVPDNQLKVLPYFNGTREKPELRGSINDIAIGNLTAYNLLYGFSEAIVLELKDLFDSNNLGNMIKLNKIVGSGNAIRRNPMICKLIQNKFNCELILSNLEEEAASGAAIYAEKGLNFGKKAEYKYEQAVTKNTKSI